MPVVPLLRGVLTASGPRSGFSSVSGRNEIHDWASLPRPARGEICRLSYLFVGGAVVSVPRWCCRICSSVVLSQSVFLSVCLLSVDINLRCAPLLISPESQGRHDSR